MTDFRAKRLAAASLVLMAMLWGSAFVVTKGTLARLGALDLLALRYALAMTVLALFAWKHLKMSRETWFQGAIMGVLFTSGQILQTIGLESTAASISGFLTGTCVVFTPLLARFSFGERIRTNVWRAAALAFLGLGVLSLTPGESGTFGLGAVLTLLSALAFAGHILATGRFATKHNAMSLTLAQTAMISAITAVSALPGGLTLPGTSDWFAIGYLALIAGALTLFLQSWAQAHVEPVWAAVIMCSEPLWAAIFAVSFGTESLTWQLLGGGSAIIAAMYIVVAPTRRLRLTSIVRPITQSLKGADRGVDRSSHYCRVNSGIGSLVRLEAALHQRT